MDFHWLNLRSNRILLPLTAVAVLGMIYVESGKREVRSPWYDEMLRAAEISAEAARHLKDYRLERGVFVDRINDPAETALIGQEYTQITTDRGYLDAKLASTDPNFAAAIVEMLRQLEVEDGACAAVAMTGSFPALNLSVLAALDALGMKVASISSVGASNYGATDPFFTWLDMEAELVSAGVLSTPSLAASLGGGNDTGRGLSPRGRELLQAAATRHAVPLIAAEQLESNVQRRVGLYRQGCTPQEIGVFVNVGGGVASLGHSLNADLIPSGPSATVPMRNFPFRGVLLRLNEEGVPVIHLLNVRALRDRYGLVAAQGDPIPPGVGEVFGRTRYSVVRAVVVGTGLAALLIALFAFDRRVHRLGNQEPDRESPEGSREGEVQAAVVSLEEEAS
ncbi:MAG: poly-gamma-glutamate system protein [Acidobacteriota bacterium]